jgi:uncharacterized Tic20 family protein
MSEPLGDGINFAKIVTVLAIVFAISLGLCGVTVALTSTVHGGGSVLIFGMIVEAIAMGLSALGLLVTVIVWVIASIASGRGRG